MDKVNPSLCNKIFELVIVAKFFRVCVSYIKLCTPVQAIKNQDRMQVVPLSHSKIKKGDFQVFEKENTLLTRYIYTLCYCLRVGYMIEYATLAKSPYSIMYSQKRSFSSRLNEMVYYNNTGNISLKNHLMRNAELSHAVESLNISKKKRQKSQAPRHS